MKLMFSCSTPVFLAIIILPNTILSQKMNSHVIYNKKMKKTKFKKILKKAENADVIFFGEMHDDPICHWLELKLLKEQKRVYAQDLKSYTAPLDNIRKDILKDISAIIPVNRTPVAI